MDERQDQLQFFVDIGIPSERSDTFFQETYKKPVLKIRPEMETLVKSLCFRFLRRAVFPHANKKPFTILFMVYIGDLSHHRFYSIDPKPLIHLPIFQVFLSLPRESRIFSHRTKVRFTRD